MWVLLPTRSDLPTPVLSGDCNCDEAVDLDEVVYLVDHLCRGGPPPRC